MTSAEVERFGKWIVRVPTEVWDRVADMSTNAEQSLLLRTCWKLFYIFCKHLYRTIDVIGCGGARFLAGRLSGTYVASVTNAFIRDITLRTTMQLECYITYPLFTRLLSVLPNLKKLSIAVPSTNLPILLDHLKRWKIIQDTQTPFDIIKHVMARQLPLQTPPISSVTSLSCSGGIGALALLKYLSSVETLMIHDPVSWEDLSATYVIPADISVWTRLTTLSLYISTTTGLVQGFLIIGRSFPNLRTLFLQSNGMNAMAVIYTLSISETILPRIWELRLNSSVARRLPDEFQERVDVATLVRTQLPFLEKAAHYRPQFTIFQFGDVEWRRDASFNWEDSILLPHNCHYAGAALGVRRLPWISSLNNELSTDERDEIQYAISVI